VAKVEEVLGRVTAARKRLASVSMILKRFRQAVLASACSGRLTEAWRSGQQGLDCGDNLARRIGQHRRERYVGACCEAKLAGHRKPREYDNVQPRPRVDFPLFELPEEWIWVDLRFVMDEQQPFCYGVVQPGEDRPSGVPLIRAGDLQGGTVDLSFLRRIPVEIDAQYSRSRVAGGELLVTVVGAGIGTVAIVPPTCKGYNIARAVAKIPVRDFSARYVYYWLKTLSALTWMKEDAREVARPTLNLEQLQTLPVPLPSLAEQQEIVQRLDTLFKLIEAIENRLAAATARAEGLPQTILARAFRGELVPTEAELARQEGRDYEPASALLERIRGEQANRETEAVGKNGSRSRDQKKQNS